MKKILIILLSVLLSMFLIACGTSVNEGSAAMSEETVLTWPKDKLGSVPQLKGITITEITDIENGVLMTFEGCDEKETKMYTYQLTKEGWEFTTENTDEGKTAFASKQNESLIFFSPIYDGNNEIGTITYTITD